MCSLYCSYLVHLTFFCKRGRHEDCPGQWPEESVSGINHDCSFDVKMLVCQCRCHIMTR